MFLWNRLVREHNVENRVFAGRYRVTEKIGIGGMAEVFKAQDETLGRTVAVKTMLPQYASDPTFAARFRQEAQAAANLSSPYIVNIYDWGQDQDTYFIVMEYVRGIDLKNAIRQRGAINQRKVAEIGSQICSALSVAHGYDIIHRDIKPQNIMVQPDGNIKVMDFGIARAGNSNLTQTSSVLGTAHYVSPEQAQGKKLTVTSDLYSLGVVLYEAVTGKLPFDAPDAVSVAMKQVSEQPLPPSALKPDIDPTLEAIILHALEKDPEQRFPSANDMRAALNNFLTGRPVVLNSADATSAPTTVMNSVADPYIPTAVAGGTAVMPAIDGESMPMGSGAYNSRSPIEYSRRGPEDERGSKKKEGRSKGPIIAIIAILLVIAAIITTLTLSQCSAGNGTVPDVVGMTKSKAESAIVKAGYTVGAETEATSDTVGAGYVISQSPDAKAAADAGAKIDIVVSTGPQKAATVTVPDLTNMTEPEAQNALTKAGLKYKAGTAQNSDTVDTGKVISQTPTANSTVDSGSTVTYILSTGKKSVDVPNVLNESEGQAKTALNNKGLQVNTTYKNSDSVSEGNVISQDPAGGSSVSSGSTVNIVISLGPTEVTTTTVPNLVGLTLDQVKSALSSANLVLGSTTGDTTKTVTSSNPAYKTTVNKNSTVDVVFPSSTPTGGGGN